MTAAPSRSRPSAATPIRTSSAASPGELLITSDNTYGTPRQDAFRRDFTVNALFYSVGDYSVIDHVGGIEDLERKLIRAIGDPEVRFREDPVRMLRACEFAGRLGFGIEAQNAGGDPPPQQGAGEGLAGAGDRGDHPAPASAAAPAPPCSGCWSSISCRS